MALYTKKHRFFQTAALYTGACLLLSYFAFHTYNGAYGIKAQKHYALEIKALEKDLAELKGKREKLSHKVSLLHPEKLDPDLLEERAREVLNYVYPNEVILLEKRN